MNMNKIRSFFLDLLFPKRCLGCGKSDTYLCPDCFNKIQIIPNKFCFFCKKISWQGKICLEHKPSVYLDRIISATEYRNPLIRDLIKSFKYHYVQELAEPLSLLLVETLKSFDLELKASDYLIIPVPLHGRKLRHRGFNQAELLAKIVANYFNLPIEANILKRIVPTSPQANIKNVEKRKTNLQNIFEVNPDSGSIKEKTIILIDDVATTGATLIEAAKVLKSNGAKEIWALTVAKG
jgi:ComF family protein